jgi:hypothetical protein
MHPLVYKTPYIAECIPSKSSQFYFPTEHKSCIKILSNTKYKHTKSDKFLALANWQGLRGVPSDSAAWEPLAVARMSTGPYWVLEPQQVLTVTWSLGFAGKRMAENLSDPTPVSDVGARCNGGAIRGVWWKNGKRASGWGSKRAMAQLSEAVSVNYGRDRVWTLEDEDSKWSW